MSNPYIAGSSIWEPGSFIGRQDILKEIASMLHSNRENTVVIYGQRRMGKTSILKHVEMRLRMHDSFLPIFFDFHSLSDATIEKILINLTKLIVRKIGMVQSELHKDIKVNFFHDWLPNILTSLPETMKLVLLFDEFDVLAERTLKTNARQLFQLLSVLQQQYTTQLKIIYVIGRSLEDLDSSILTVFKSAKWCPISLLTFDETMHLVLQSARMKNLYWQKRAAERVWELTKGHAYFTQHLCHQVWNSCYSSDTGRYHIVTVEDVDRVVDDALDVSSHALEWIWAGLNVYTRLILITLAKHSRSTIMAQEIEKLIAETAGDLISDRILDQSLQVLVDWQVLQLKDSVYTFQTELFRRWIASGKEFEPLYRELNNPLNSLMSGNIDVAKDLFEAGDDTEAIELCQQNLRTNPLHFESLDLLVELYFSTQQFRLAYELLEKCEPHYPMVFKTRLIKASLRLATDSHEREEQRRLYKRVLELEPDNRQAAEFLSKMLEQDMKQYYAQGVLAEARTIACQLVSDFSWIGDWHEDLAAIDTEIQQAELQEMYQEVQQLIFKKDYENAKWLLIKMQSIEFGFKDVNDLWLRLVTGRI